MADELPIACTADPSELPRRLAEMAEIGANDLIEHRTDGGRHLLRFRSSARTRRQLEAILAAEARCCPFLDFALEECRGELVLSLSAPGGAEPVAAALAATFAGEAS
jgi:hypothetical protein